MFLNLGRRNWIDIPIFWTLISLTDGGVTGAGFIDPDKCLEILKVLELFEPRSDEGE